MRIIRVLCERLLTCMSVSFHFGFDGGMKDLIALVPYHCLSFFIANTVQNL